MLVCIYVTEVTESTKGAAYAKFEGSFLGFFLEFSELDFSRLLLSIDTAFRLGAAIAIRVVVVEGGLGCREFLASWC